MPVDLLKTTRLENCEDFSPFAVFECGQAFRWNENENGEYEGIAFGCPARVWKENETVYILSEEGSFEKIWYDYFDLSRNYKQCREILCREKSLRPACDFGKGIRILNQDPWEAFCSFIISQCNNIPRIKSIIETLCKLCGSEKELDGKRFFAFPSADVVAGLSDEELSTLHAGYRAEYIKFAAEAVSCGELDLSEIKKLPTDKAKEELMKSRGVGDKVASCTLLFGMGKLDAFPVDVWMKRAIEFFFGSAKFDYRRFGGLSGLAQQYMFHYMRNNPDI